MQFFIYNYLLQPSPALESYSSWTCKLFHTTFYLFPSSPITLQNIADSIGDSLPFVGGRLTYMAIVDLSKVLFVVIIWKIFSSLPGKF
jgi:hypothetical protein